MINIDKVELSKSTANVNETITIKITATEVMSTWQDIKQKTWQQLLSRTWEQIKRKIF